MKKIGVSIVSYTNSRPFLFGLEKYQDELNLEISLDDPSQCARKLAEGIASIGLVPVISISEIPNAEVISDYGIAADGEVLSVVLVGEVPLQSMKGVLLDYESRTSAALLKILAKEYWKVPFSWQKAEPGFEHDIHGLQGGLLIGDRALQLRDKFNYVYDLSAEWKSYTNKAFVFAQWVANTGFDAEFKLNFNMALRYGTEAIDKLVDDTNLMNSLPPRLIGKYLKQHIKYFISPEMKEGMNLFLEKQNVYTATG